MTEPDFDVAVVGAGPAGSMAAMRLAQRNLSVVLVERGERPGEKNLSGGVLYPAPLADALPDFPRDPTPEAPWERRVVRHVTSSVRPDSVTSLDYEDAALLTTTGSAGSTAALPNAVTVLRARLDPWLAERAQEAGAFLMPGMRVDSLVTEPGPDGAPRVTGIRADGQDLRARVVVAADGVNSFLARGAGLRPDPAPRDLAVGVKAVLAMPAGRLEDRFGLEPGQGAAHALVGDVTAGVAGGAFLYTNRESLSFGVVLRLDALTRSGRSAHEVFEHALTHPRLRRWLAGAEVIEYGSHLVSESGHTGVGQVAFDGLVVAGDAAGLTINSGLVLRGMDLAITSGLLAGDAVAEAIEAGDASATGLHRYAAALQASTAGADMRTYARTPALFHRPGPYGPWGEAAERVLRGSFRLDGAPRRPLRHLAVQAVRRSGVGLRTWVGDAAALWRSV
ncbi:FAD-dependent oxidoreductase [Serinibacter salmoneus]|uniref:Electron transfer flavoprotein-quinone oxidoreductase n=1 Tax=Serinibacter salmoneus TaxID=556530 RepID=A0A2A9D2B8_9MICO|nr:FAD-dependent oxidoreductase [Serinibacter salmoneus]PFG19999.1 electron transfer flavoprotein-quinone oxidoreductase [Serinibacter salmoneus]